MWHAATICKATKTNKKANKQTSHGLIEYNFANRDTYLYRETFLLFINSYYYKLNFMLITN